MKSVASLIHLAEQPVGRLHLGGCLKRNMLNQANGLWLERLHQDEYFNGRFQGADLLFFVFVLEQIVKGSDKMFERPLLFRLMDSSHLRWFTVVCRSRMRRRVCVPFVRRSAARIRRNVTDCHDDPDFSLLTKTQ